MNPPRAGPDSGPATLSHYEGYFATFTGWLKLTRPEILALRDVIPAIAGEYALQLTRGAWTLANSFTSTSDSSNCFSLFSGNPPADCNPWEGNPRKRVVTESRRELTTDELRSVCSARLVRCACSRLGIYTGLRLGDAATLRWSEVDLRRRIIRRNTKQGGRRQSAP